MFQIPKAVVNMPQAENNDFSETLI